MKTEHRYRWRVIDRGRPRLTRVAMTEAEVRRDYPECEPEPLPETPQVVQLPETADELLRALEHVPVGHSTSTPPADANSGPTSEKTAAAGTRVPPRR